MQTSLEAAPSEERDALKAKIKQAHKQLRVLKKAWSDELQDQPAAL
jgi:hypothetical protein